MLGSWNYVPTIFVGLLSTVLAAVSITQISCPQMCCQTPAMYCLNRDPREVSSVQVVDTSHKNVRWSWDTGTGRWDVAYVNSLANGNFALDACFIQAQSQQLPCCISYSPATSWQCDRRPIIAAAWDMSCAGDSFGFKPLPGGQYVFHIYSRNLHYNPWQVAQPPPAKPPQKETCIQTRNDRTEGEGWWLERKSPYKCPIVVNRKEVQSPMEWNWESDGGKWKTTYTFNSDVVKCTIDYTPSQGSTSRLVEWTFDKEKLVLSYSSSPKRVYNEYQWRLMVNNGETWGFSPTQDGAWTSPVYSRNVVIQPFERSNGAFNLQLPN